MVPAIVLLASFALLRAAGFLGVTALANLEPAASHWAFSDVSARRLRALGTRPDRFDSHGPSRVPLPGNYHHHHGRARNPGSCRATDSPHDSCSRILSCNSAGGDVPCKHSRSSRTANNSGAPGNGAGASKRDAIDVYRRSGRSCGKSTTHE